MTDLNLKKARTNSFLVLIASLLMLSGCAREESNLVWVHQYRCLGEIDGKNNALTCKGQSEDAGVLEIKLFPAEGFALVHVVSQDPKNASMDLIRISPCVIWDRHNWHCNVSVGGAYSVHYFVRGDRYTSSFFVPEEKSTYSSYWGELRDGAASK
jgi:hypothetical protein